MPFTPAHAAAVVPLSRWKPYFWLSPLVIGSMAPDFAYFIPLPRELRHIGHTPWGLLWFCIPAGLAVLYAFHRFFKRPLAMLLPQPVRARLWPHCGRYQLFPPRRLAWICALIFLGAVTHVVWDSFTHEYIWAASDYPQLHAVLFTVAGYHVHYFGLLQYGSSVFGLGLLAWWSWQWYRRTPPGWAPAGSDFQRRARPAIAAAMVIFGAGMGIICGLIYAGHLAGPFNVNEFLQGAFISGIDAFGFALLVFVCVERKSFHLLEKDQATE